MKRFYALIILISGLTMYPQGTSAIKISYPDNYFRSPLSIPLILSGTFGELRSNHFHSGLDIKTQQQEGIKVFTTAEGYVSRIKISHWGYGKAIYITHPNGYTSVYAHLKRFNNRIEAYVKKQQYKKESYEIQLFPSAEALPISKDEIIAISGNSGGSAGPHLHFEIRDSKTEKTINPMLFGINIKDSKKPRIIKLIGYPLSKAAHIDKLGFSKQIGIKRLENGTYLADKINALGKIGFGINSYDQLDGAANKNGLYSLEMFVNGSKIHDFKAETFSFSESKYINLLIDYEHYDNSKSRIQKCYIEPLNKLSMYTKNPTNGYITIKEGLNYSIEIVAKDFQGNSQSVKIPVVGKKEVNIVQKEIKETSFWVDRNIYNKFEAQGVSIAIPKYAFYENFFMDFKVKDTVVNIHSSKLPMHKNFTLTFDVSDYTENDKKELYIASVNDKNYSQYVSTIKKENIFYTSTKNLGRYTLKKDSINPQIKRSNFNDQQWVTNFNTLKLKISDKGSGIKSYRAEIDGEWVLMEYEPKKAMLTYNLNDKKFETAKHELTVKVTDNVGNETISTSTFFRKK